MIKYFRKALKVLHQILIKVFPLQLYSKIYFYVSYLINDATIKKHIRKTGFGSLQDFQNNYSKKSDTVFILGSGDSINNITSHEWEYIKKHDSIGFNFWHIHDFVPNIFIFEENEDLSRNNIFYDILNNKALDYKNTSIIVKDVEHKGISKDKIPKVLHNNTYISTDMIIGHSKSLRKFLYNIYYMCHKVNIKKLKIIPKKTGSLSYCVFLAIFLGYKNIVLCGVDLSDINFYYYAKKYSNHITPKNDTKGLNIHLTESNYNNNIPISEILNIVNEDILKKDNIKLLNFKDKNNLMPFLDVFNFKKNI